MLVPDGWHFRTDTQQQELTYHCTSDKDDTIRSGARHTLAVLQVLRNVESIKKQTELPVHNKAQAMLRHTELFESKTNKILKGRLECRTQHEYPDMRGLPDEEAYLLALFNRRTHTLYLLVFTALARDWKEVWPLGEVMIKNLTVDSEF